MQTNAPNIWKIFAGPHTLLIVLFFNLRLIFDDTIPKEKWCSRDGWPWKCLCKSSSTPKNFSRKISSAQIKNIIYKLAIEVWNKSNNSKGTILPCIVTTFEDSKSWLTNAPWNQPIFHTLNCRTLLNNLKIWTLTHQTFFNLSAPIQFFSKNEIGKWINKPHYYAF